jgi:hypothetical protein
MKIRVLMEGEEFLNEFKILVSQEGIILLLITNYFAIHCIEPGIVPPQNAGLILY